ncbi:MAG: hypothetical protein KDA89_23445, partial [Planctomycetaceae bacterium]|nr:hypothetical protein [Planctomycetaceae bacterium]
MLAAGIGLEMFCGICRADGDRNPPPRHRLNVPTQSSGTFRSRLVSQQNSQPGSATTNPTSTSAGPNAAQSNAAQSNAAQSNAAQSDAADVFDNLDVNRQLTPRPVDDSELPPGQMSVPLQETPLPERTVIEADGEFVTLVVREAPLSSVLNALAEQCRLNVVTAGSIGGQVSVTLNQVPLEDALNAILHVNGYRWVLHRQIIMVSSMTGSEALPPHVQGRMVRVFRLNFASATDIDKTIQGMLSPVGKSSVTVVESADKLRTREELVVEDLPDYMDRISNYIAQADCPPAQVLIEAHVLQVALKNENRHGVDLTQLARIASADVKLQTNGIASSAASPAFLLNVDGTDMDALLEVIRGTTDAKTLASPKVLAVNGQEARIQIGQQLGYLTTTTTQTSTLQDVQFIDLGVVLSVTPLISSDGQVLMTVKPEVSSGRINPATGLPEEETTEVETTVLLPNGHAMVIGGLIKEENSDQQSKLPLLGDVPVMGKLFQRRNRLRSRNEIIIALIPRVVPYCDDAQCRQIAEIQRAVSPLVTGPLVPVDRRRQEPALPDDSEIIDDYGRRMETFPVPP